jgi:imidazolonepropionase-like amidohydrolase
MPRLVIALLALVFAQSAVADTTAIVNAHIYSMGPAGEVKSGTVLIRNGKIVAVGANVSVPRDAEIVDAGGKIVTPGLYIPNTNLLLSRSISSKARSTPRRKTKR